MCCSCKNRCFIGVIALWAIIQSVGFTTMSILAILVHKCDLAMVDTTLSYLMYLIYFRNGDCGDIQWENLGSGIDNSIQPTMPTITDIAYRTNIFAIIYLILSLTWIATSVGLLIGIFISCLGRCGYYVLFIPWIVVGFVTIIFDAIASGFFVYDVTQTLGLENLLTYLQVKNVQEVIAAVGDVSPFLTYVPSILLMLTSSRGFILWAINIALVVLVLKFGKETAKRIPKAAKTITKRPNFGYEAKQNSSDVNRRNNPNTIQPIAEQMRYNNPLPVHNSNYEFDNPIFERDQSDFNIPRAILPNAPIRDSQISHQRLARLSQIQPKGFYDSVHSNPHNDMNMHSQYSQNNKKRAEFLPTNNRSIDQISTDSGWTSPGNMSEDDKRSNIDRSEKPLPPVKPIKPSRNNNLAGYTDDVVRDRNSQIIPPEELRSQLPWSYTSNREDITGPKRTFISLRDDEELPPVPVPDYTLHFPKNKRQGINEDYE